MPSLVLYFRQFPEGYRRYPARADMFVVNWNNLVDCTTPKRFGHIFFKARAEYNHKLITTSIHTLWYNTTICRKLPSNHSRKNGMTLKLWIPRVIWLVLVGYNERPSSLASVQGVRISLTSTAIVHRRGPYKRVLRRGGLFHRKMKHCRSTLFCRLLSFSCHVVRWKPMFDTRLTFCLCSKTKWSLFDGAQIQTIQTWMKSTCTHYPMMATIESFCESSIPRRYASPDRRSFFVRCPSPLL